MSETAVRLHAAALLGAQNGNEAGLKRFRINSFHEPGARLAGGACFSGVSTQETSRSG